MQTYNVKVRLAGELHNEVEKKNLIAAEILVLRKIHGADAVVDIKPSGEWEDHYSIRKTQRVDENTGHVTYVDEEVDYDDEAEKERLAATYGSALILPQDAGSARNAVNRMFDEYAPLPVELPEMKKARKDAAKASKKGNLDKVA